VGALQGLEQRVGGGGGGSLEAAQDGHPPTGLDRDEGELVLEVAHLLDLQAVADPFGCDDVQVRMVAAGDQVAGAVRTTRDFPITLAQQGGSKCQRQRRLGHARWPGE